MRFLMNQALITSLTAVITTSRCCIRFIRLKPTSLSEQKRISSTNPSNGNVGCLRMCFQTQVYFSGFYPKQYYPEPIRLVKYWDEEQKREFIFITNAMHISALQVAELYKNRWQVELFFKWLKQHLKIKRFWGTTENAVRIQIYAAICTYCLVAIIQHDMKLDRSTYEVLQILSISLTDKTHLRDLFDKTKFQNDKERFGPNGPSLFNF